MAYYNCSLMSDSEIQEKYPNLLKDGYTPADIRTEITAWQDKQRKTLKESYKYDTVPSEEEIYNRIEEKELTYYNSPAYEKELQDILAKAPRDKEGHLLAPNGKPTNLTERQYAQVRTKSFKRWFGDWINNPETASKVVDENGEPLVVYHTTDDKTMVAGKANFTIFSKKENNGKMFYFTDNRPMSESYIQKNRTFKSLNDVNERIILLKERLEKAEKYIDDLEHPENYINRVRKLKNMTFDEYIAYLGFDNLEDFKKQNANENLKKEAYRDKQNILNEINRLKNFTETDLIATRSFFLNIKSPEIFEGNNANWNELSIFGETSDSIEQKKKYMKDKSAYKAEMLEKYASLSNPKSYENYTLYGIGLYGEDLEDMLSDFYFEKWITDVSEKFPLDYSKDLAAISTRGIEQYINSNTSSSVDGFIVKNIYDYGIGAIFTPKEKLTSGTVIATKNPNQIKSATDNIGTFSRTNDRIDRFTEQLNETLDYLESTRETINTTFSGSNLSEIFNSFKGELNKIIKTNQELNHYDLGETIKPNDKLESIKDAEAYSKYIQSLISSIIKKLESQGKSIEIKVSSINSAMAIDSSGSTIKLFYNPTLLLADFNRFDYILAHELIHSVTSNAINNSFSKTATKEEEQFANDIWDIIVDLYNNKQFHWDFGFDLNKSEDRASHIKEFIANVMTNPNLQSRLAQIKTEDKKQSLWSKFISIIKNLLNKYLGVDIKDSYLEKLMNTISSYIENQTTNINSYNNNITDRFTEDIKQNEESQQTPVYQTPTLEEDTKINAAFPNTSIRRDRVNLIKRLIYKGLSKEYDRQLAELEQRILDANNIEGEEERQKVISELESSKNSLTEDKAIELGIGNVIKEVKETLNPDSPSNSKEAERARLMKIEGFRKLDSEKQEQIVENNYQKKNKAYRIIQDNWNSLIDEVLPLINDEYGLKIDKSSEPDIDEDAGRDMYQVKARNEDMRSSLSKEIKKLISNVRWIRPDGKILKDDLGFAKYLNSDYVHISLLESLSKARSCMDFWNIFENLALKKPWVNELKKELDKNESLKSKFYQDFRKEFIPYWIEYEYETNKKTGQKKRVTKRVNKTAFLYNTLDSWKDNLEGGTILNDFHIFNEDRSINNDNIEKVLKVVTDLTSKYQEAHNNSLTSGRQEVIDFISDNLPRIKTVIESLGLEVDSDSLNETLNEKDANISEILSVTSEMLNKLKKGILDGKDINNNPIQLDFFDTLGGYATRLAKAINTIDKDSVLKSFRESGKSYQSYTVPSYFGKVLENLKNGSAEDIRQYLMNNYGKYEWFYDHNTNQWRNEWLRAIYENPDKYKNIIERKVVLHSDKKDFNDWGDKQYALSMLTEFGLEDKSKKTAYYYLPVLADAESAEFIQFERFIGSDDKFKADIRKKLSSVVWQEYYRIQLVKQRKKEGATPIDNFDKRGEKFCFIPELNTLKDNNGKLFIDSLTSYIINGESLEADTLIDYALDKILTDGFTDFYNKLNETGVLAQTKDNKNVFFGYSAEDMNNALVNFYYNNALAQTQIIELLTTDLAFYKSLNDFQKRFKEVYVMNRKLNTTSKYGRKFEKTVILKDLKIKAPSYDTIKEILDKAVEDKRISTSTRDRILGLYADGKVNVTDAQAFRSLSSYKAVLDMAGRWTNEMDEAMDRMKDGSFSDEDFETIFQTIKPFVYTQTTKSTGVKITKDFGEYLKTPMQCKNSEFLLINALNTMVFALSDSGKLKAIEQFMEDYNVDVVQFESAVKCGGQGKLDLSTLSDSDYNGVYDYLKKTTGFNVDSENGNSDYVTIIDYEDYGIQTENPEHLLDTQALFGTQIRKLIFEDIPEKTTFNINGKEFSKKELWDLYNKLISTNVFFSYKDIEKEFGSIEGIAKLVQKQVKENPLMYSEELRKACELVEVKDEKTGEVHKEFNLPIYDPVQRNRIEALLLSVIKNTVVKQKIKGASCVQVSCFGTTDSLHIERTEDGGIKYIECYLPAYSKKFFQSFFKKDKDGKPYLDINELPEDLRRCIGYRIPTEGHYSMQPLYIKGFLPVQNGSMIMLPAEITQLTGSDFDIDKVFLMLPEFNIGDYIKKEKLKKDFKKYLEENKPDLYKKYISEYTLRDRELKSFDKKAFENDFDITLKQIIHNTDEESALRLPQNFSEDTFEMELFDFLNDNKNKYSSKLSKVKYDFNKSFEENLDDKDPKEARRRINNALMDIMYGILTSKEAAPKILDGGNFDLAKKGDRICQIADNLKGENISTLADELEVEHSYKAVLDKLESMNVKQLNKILEDIQGELSPITPTTNLYFHSQNANGGKMIGVYANNSVANAMFQMANITLVENEKTGIMPVIFGGKEFKKFGNFYDMNGNPISRNIKNFLAASVDNVKDPVLKGLMQNPVTGSITCMLINLGIDIDSVGLFLNQPMIKEVISIMEDDREVSCETAVNRVLKNHNLLSIEVEDKIYQNYSNLMKEDLFKNIINESDVADIVFLDKFKEYMDKADNYRKIVSILRGDTSKGSIESTIAGCLKRINDFLFLYKKNPHFHIGNLLTLLTKKEDFDNFEDYYKNIENSSIPFISSFTSSGILATESLLKPYTPFFNSSITSILFDDNYGITSLYTKDVIPENVFESVMNDWFLFVLNKGEFFNSTKTENITRYDAEDRDYFINKFPEDFKKLKETIPELKDNQFIKKIIPVYPERKNKNGKRSKGYFPFTRLKFQNSGSLSQLQIDNYSRDWLSLLSSNDIRLNKLGRALFKYATYFGFGFSPESFIRMASVNARKSIPDYVETIKNIDNFNDESKNSLFVFQYLLNHTNDDNLVPNIEIDTRNISNSVVTFSPENVKLFDKVVVNHFKNGDNYYQVVRPVIKVTINGETKVYSTSKVVTPMGEEVHYYETIPLGYKGKVFEYQYNSVPSSVINKTSSIDNSEIESSEEDDWGDNGFTASDERSSNIKNNNIPQQKSPDSLKDIDCNPIGDVDGKVACVI